MKILMKWMMREKQIKNNLEGSLSASFPVFLSLFYNKLLIFYDALLDCRSFTDDTLCN